MSDILGIALSGASAATKRIDATASNLANQRTTGRLPDAKGTVSADSRAPYTPLTTSQVPGLDQVPHLIPYCTLPSRPARQHGYLRWSSWHRHPDAIP